MNSSHLETLRSLCRDDDAFEQMKQFLGIVPCTSPEVDVQYLTQQQQAVFGVIARIRASLDLETIFQATATEVRQLLGADRVGVFRFYPESGWNDGEFVSEDVSPEFPSALAARIHDHCFGERYSIYYAKGKIQAVSDILQGDLSACHIEVLSRFHIRANLIVPLLKGDLLWGLLCIHQCAAPRQWQPLEIEFVTQIATQLGVALQQAELLEQTKQQANQLAQTVQELKQTQTQLVQTEKMSSLGQLVAGVAHEINNPVNFIHGNVNYASKYAQDLLELLRLYQQHYPDPIPEIMDYSEAIDLEFLHEDLPKMLASMKMGTDRIRQIVLSLRNFSRLDQAEMKPVDIHEGIDSTLLILQHRLKATSKRPNIEIFRGYGNLPAIECYAGQLNQVFMNILSNAIDAVDEAIEEGQWNMENGHGAPHSLVPDRPLPAIVIRTEKVDDRILIRISDNGPGIKAEIVDRLFDPFFTTKPIGKGTGLGLAISYQIVVEKHGGQLRCTSEVGKGTEFEIEIPTCQSVKMEEGAGLSQLV
ncbi:MAG: ATP-binding protein [Leptolyngbyaceae cyanobacterium bins.59]|nr:ATP-binding protein [Leptolyngbyaceae cyanobacterium bins.59]